MYDIIIRDGKLLKWNRAGIKINYKRSNIHNLHDFSVFNGNYKINQFYKLFRQSIFSIFYEKIV